MALRSDRRRTASGLDLDGVIRLLVTLFTADVVGAAVNAHMQRTDRRLAPVTRVRMEATRLLRLQNAERLRAHLSSRLGVAADRAVSAEDIRGMLANLPPASLRERQLMLEDSSMRGVETCRRLRILYGEIAPLFCANLMAKEIAMRDFARDELDGHADHALDRIVALLDPEARLALDLFDPETAAGQPTI